LPTIYALFEHGKNFLDILKQQPPAWNAAGSAADDYGTAVDTADAKTKALAESWAALDGRLSKDQAMSQAKDLIAGLNEQLDKYNKNINQDNPVGRKNREAIIGDIQDERSALQGLVSQHVITQDQADKMFATWLKGFEKSAEKAGVTKKSIQDLNKQLDLLPNVVPINIKVNVSTRDALTKAGHGKIQYFASGGRYQAGQPRIVGEDGPELDIPDHSGVIIPNGARSSAMPGSGSGTGVGGSAVQVVFTAGDNAAAALLALLRPEIRGQYRGNVSAALGGAR